MQNRIEKLRAFLEKSPDDCFLNHALALEYIKMDNDIDARLLFEKNREKDPSYIATYYHLGKLLERAGEQQAAIAVYEAGMEQSKKAGDNHSHSELRGAWEDLVY
jgi:tetratricopeptide (TPR) repeat protein